MKKLGIMASIAGLAFGSFGSGFSLYEASALSTALGGAVVGEAVDASANFYNPATLSDLTNVTVTIGFVTEHPRSRIKVNGESDTKLDPGFFVLPHFQLAVPLPYDFTFGLGFAPEYGLGTEYGRHWSMDWDSLKTTVEGFTLNPNLSYAINDRWSVGAGLRWLYFTFEQTSHPYNDYARLSNHLKGDNDFEDWGWQVGTRYRLTDDISLGLMYKSEIEASIRDGRCTTHNRGYDDAAINATAAQLVEQQCAMMGIPYAMAVAAGKVSEAAGKVRGEVAKGIAEANGPASADLELPQSITAGFNWDIADDWHLGAAFSWTDWSCLDTLTFRLPNGQKPVRLKWQDTYRFCVAPSWDFADDWTAMLSYVYDTDACSSTQDSTMLPPGDRHIFSMGLSWRCWKGLELALSYGIVFMDGTPMHMSGPGGADYELQSHRGLSHAGGFSVTYRF